MTLNNATNFTITAIDDISVGSCLFRWDGLIQKIMYKTANNVWWALFVPNTTGIHITQASCSDGLNIGYGLNTTVTVGGDVISPTVSAVSPTLTALNKITNFTITATDNTDVYHCRFYWDGASQNSMSKTNDSVWWVVLIPNMTGTHAAQAQCLDSASNLGYGSNTTIRISSPYFPQTTKIPDIDGHGI